LSSYPERNPSAGTRLRELMGQFKSDIKLDISIQTRFPSPGKSSQITGYTIHYKIDYGRFQGKWVEENIKQELHLSKNLEIEYIFGD
jgi:hypothetical protein